MNSKFWLTVSQFPLVCHADHTTSPQCQRFSLSIEEFLWERTESLSLSELWTPEQCLAPWVMSGPQKLAWPPLLHAFAPWFLCLFFLTLHFPSFHCFLLLNGTEDCQQTNLILQIKGSMPSSNPTVQNSITFSLYIPEYFPAIGFIHNIYKPVLLQHLPRKA